MYVTSPFPVAVLTHPIPSNVWINVNAKLEGLVSLLYEGNGLAFAWRE